MYQMSPLLMFLLPSPFVCSISRLLCAHPQSEVESNGSHGCVTSRYPIGDRPVHHVEHTLMGVQPTIHEQLIAEYKILCLHVVSNLRVSVQRKRDITQPVLSAAPWSKNRGQ